MLRQRNGFSLVSSSSATIPLKAHTHVQSSVQLSPTATGLERGERGKKMTADEFVVKPKEIVVAHVPHGNVPTQRQSHSLNLQSTATVTQQSSALRKRRRSLDSALSLATRPSPSLRNPRILLDHFVDKSALRGSMLAAPPIDLTFDEDSDWLPPSDVKNRLIRTASVGNSWGVTSIGGGYSWSSRQKNNDRREEYVEDEAPARGSFIEPESPKGTRLSAVNGFSTAMTKSPSRPQSLIPPRMNGEADHNGAFTEEPISTETPFSYSPVSSAPRLGAMTPDSISSNFSGDAGRSRTPLHRSASMPRPRRRSSQQRVSLVSGRLSMVSIDLPSDEYSSAPRLQRVGSQSSFLSAISTRAPTPAVEKESFLGGRSISEFVIEGELGRGAYGLVKRAREMNADGTMGVRGVFLTSVFLR